ncbi:uncharacterized protein EDB91DRAFT_1086263 [Suillus paluster]|uniref:uncharacterized protein n=1 Tax=Suillus paluster TaxID=48578 RepID=UPI001B8651BF|nr:uncharacterized protein EDB91DRAFT_1086263 [Suillus paluster]KAG1727962.1 hypothetical protein EDB91DRAFT_1086263 [Suillus paluster]
MPGLIQNLPIFQHEPVPLLLPRFEFPDPPQMSESPVKQEMLDYRFLTGEDLDIMTHGSELPNLGPNFHSPEAMLDAVNHFEDYNTRTAADSHPLTSHLAHNLPNDPELRAMQCEFEHAYKQLQEEEKCADTHADEDEDADIDVDACSEHDDEDTEVLIIVEPEEDTPDPFMPEEGTTADDYVNHQGVPPHLLMTYVVVSWLHLQFHLPRVACNALLAIFACMLLVISPMIDRPFVTLQSCTRVLGVDPVIQTLPVCPGCRDVFPPTGSLHAQDTCITCNISLFLPGQTRHRIQRAKKIPVIKYLYLALSEQIKSMLKILGVEAVLDEWHSKPRRAGEYTDIFVFASRCRCYLRGEEYHCYSKDIMARLL